MRWIQDRKSNTQNPIFVHVLYSLLSASFGLITVNLTFFVKIIDNYLHRLSKKYSKNNFSSITSKGEFLGVMTYRLSKVLD